MTFTRAPMATPKQIGLIHTLAQKAGMDEPTYRAFLESNGSTNSAKLLTAANASRVIDALKELTHQNAGVKGAVAGLDTPAAKKLRALWIAAWNLGLLRDRTDRAMLAFLERQTGVSHTRFLREPGAATAAIEAMKSWLARDGKVEWPLLPGTRAQANDPIAAKRAVLNAQWMRLIALGDVTPFVEHMPLAELDAYAFKVVWKNGWGFFTSHDYDLVQSALGRKLRRALLVRPMEKKEHTA